MEYEEINLQITAKEGVAYYASVHDDGFVYLRGVPERRGKRSKKKVEAPPAATPQPAADTP